MLQYQFINPDFNSVQSPINNSNKSMDESLSNISKLGKEYTAKQGLADLTNKLDEYNRYQ